MRTICQPGKRLPPDRSCGKTAATLCLLSGLLGATAALQAQTLPNAGSLLNNIERTLPSRQPDAMLVPYPPEQLIRSDEATECVFQTFRILGNQRLRLSELQPALDAYLGQKIKATELHVLTEVLEDRYRQAGLRARVYIPRQDLGASELVLQIIELPTPGRF